MKTFISMSLNDLLSDNVKFYMMKHRGGLDEAVKTMKEISKDKFNSILKYYRFYCYDSRINCYRFIISDWSLVSPKLTDWLLLGKFDGVIKYE